MTATTNGKGPGPRTSKKRRRRWRNGAGSGADTATVVARGSDTDEVAAPDDTAAEAGLDAGFAAPVDDATTDDAIDDEADTDDEDTAADDAAETEADADDAIDDATTDDAAATDTDDEDTIDATTDDEAETDDDGTAADDAAETEADATADATTDDEAETDDEDTAADDAAETEADADAAIDDATADEMRPGVGGQPEGGQEVGANDEGTPGTASRPAPPEPPSAPAPVLTPTTATASPEWTTGQLASVLTRAAAVALVLALVGFGAGLTRGATNVARAEFVYTLDQSVPDSFLREDRRLLTQVATFTSDAVLVPVAQRFDLDVDQLRSVIDIETVDLSEVLRLDVTDRDPGRALALNRAVLDQYLLVITAANPAGDSRELNRQRDEVIAALAEIDQRRQAIDRAAEEDAVLEVRQASIQRRIDLSRDRIADLQGRRDDTLVGTLSPSLGTSLERELTTAQDALATLEADLEQVAADRADLAAADEPAVDREIARLESRLSTIDDELGQRDLGPLVASPIRELSEPTVIERSAVRSGVQGAAAGLLLALPIAAWVAYRHRRRQLWLG